MLLALVALEVRLHREPALLGRFNDKTKAWRRVRRPRDRRRR
jgi:hypothetical protein